MEKLTEGFIDYNRLKIIFAILEYEYGIEEDSGNVTTSGSSNTLDDSKKRSIPDWMKKSEPSPLLNKKTKKSNLFK